MRHCRRATRRVALLHKVDVRCLWRHALHPAALRCAERLHNLQLSRAAALPCPDPDTGTPCRSCKPLDLQRLAFPGELWFVLVNPCFEAPTAEMRAVLPGQVAMSAAVHNCVMGGTLVRAHPAAYPLEGLVLGQLSRAGTVMPWAPVYGRCLEPQGCITVHSPGHCY